MGLPTPGKNKNVTRAKPSFPTSLSNTRGCSWQDVLSMTTDNSAWLPFHFPWGSLDTPAQVERPTGTRGCYIHLKASFPIHILEKVQMWCASNTAASAASEDVLLHIKQHRIWLLGKSHTSPPSLPHRLGLWSSSKDWAGAQRPQQCSVLCGCCLSLSLLCRDWPFWFGRGHLGLSHMPHTQGYKLSHHLNRLGNLWQHGCLLSLTYH